MPTKPGRKGHSLADLAELHEMPLTPQRIRDAERLVAEGAVDLDRAGRREWRDSSCPGLRIVVTRQGAGFYFVGRLGGRVVRKALGPCGTVDLAEARAAAGRLRFDATTAARITGEKRSAGGSLTLEKLWEAYIAEAEAGTYVVRRRIRENTLRSYRGVWSASLSDHGKKPIAWAAENVDRIFTPLQADGTYAANRALALLSLLFRYAMKRRLWSAGNPVADALRVGTVARHEEKPRQRFLSDAERQRFRAACLKAAQPWGDLFLFASETGLRKRALLGLRWRHVHAQRKGGRFVAAGASLLIPSDIVKGGRSDHGVDLRPEAVAALDRRWAARPEGEDDGFVFAWPDGRPLSSSPYERAFHEIADAAGIRGLRGHDLRRDLGARLVAAGTPLPVVARILGHSPASIAMLGRVYAPVSDQTARRWLLDAPTITPSKRSTSKRSTATT